MITTRGSDEALGRVWRIVEYCPYGYDDRPWLHASVKNLQSNLPLGSLSLPQSTTSHSTSTLVNASSRRESGCGKTKSGLAVMRLLPGNGHIAPGTIELEGVDLSTLSEKEMQHIEDASVA